MSFHPTVSFLLALLLAGCASEGVVVRKDSGPLPFYETLGVDGTYKFVLRDNAGSMHRQLVTPDVFERYTVGEYFNDLQPGAAETRQASNLAGARVANVSATRKVQQVGQAAPVRVVVAHNTIARTASTHSAIVHPAIAHPGVRTAAAKKTATQRATEHRAIAHKATIQPAKSHTAVARNSKTSHGPTTHKTSRIAAAKKTTRKRHVAATTHKKRKTIAKHTPAHTQKKKVVRAAQNHPATSASTRRILLASASRRH